MRRSRSRVAVRTILRLVGEVVRLVAGAFRSRAQLSAENLFLRKQLALYMERQVKPRRADDATRITLVAISWLWVAHYDRGRPHASLGPALSDPPLDRVATSSDHRLPDGHRVVATPVLGGLHHEYRVEPNAA